MITFIVHIRGFRASREITKNTKPADIRTRKLISYLLGSYFIDIKMVRYVLTGVRILEGLLIMVTTIVAYISRHTSRSLFLTDHSN